MTLTDSNAPALHLCVSLSQCGAFKGKSTSRCVSCLFERASFFLNHTHVVHWQTSLHDVFLSNQSSLDKLLGLGIGDNTKSKQFGTVESRLDTNREKGDGLTLSQRPSNDPNFDLLAMVSVPQSITPIQTCKQPSAL